MEQDAGYSRHLCFPGACALKALDSGFHLGKVIEEKAGHGGGVEILKSTVDFEDHILVQAGHDGAVDALQVGDATKTTGNAVILVGFKALLDLVAEGSDLSCTRNLP